MFLKQQISEQCENDVSEEGHGRLTETSGTLKSCLAPSLSLGHAWYRECHSTSYLKRTKRQNILLVSMLETRKATDQAMRRCRYMEAATSSLHCSQSHKYGTLARNVPRITRLPGWTRRRFKTSPKWRGYRLTGPGSSPGLKSGRDKEDSLR